MIEELWIRHFIHPWLFQVYLPERCPSTIQRTVVILPLAPCPKLGVHFVHGNLLVSDNRKKLHVAGSFPQYEFYQPSFTTNCLSIIVITTRLVHSSPTEGRNSFSNHHKSSSSKLSIGDTITWLCLHSHPTQSYHSGYDSWWKE